MTTAVRIKFSEHALRDRADRICAIATSIGFGNVVEEFPRENHHGPVVHCLTDTGIVIIKTPAKDEVITLYAISLEALKGYYCQKESKPPQFMVRVVKENERKRRFLFEEKY